MHHLNTTPYNVDIRVAALLVLYLKGGHLPSDLLIHPWSTTWGWARQASIWYSCTSFFGCLPVYPTALQPVSLSLSSNIGWRRRRGGYKGGVVWYSTMILAATAARVDQVYDLIWAYLVVTRSCRVFFGAIWGFLAIFFCFIFIVSFVTPMTVSSLTCRSAFVYPRLKATRPPPMSSRSILGAWQPVDFPTLVLS